jgi:hypothetical protein
MRIKRVNMVKRVTNVKGVGERDAVIYWGEGGMVIDDDFLILRK